MKIAAYGTLRGGLSSAKYLIDKYGPDSVKVLGDFDLPGFLLYTRPMFGVVDCPFAYPGEGTLRVSVLEIADGPAADDIDRGESWGYDKTPITIPSFGEAFLYQARPRYIEGATLVPGGDYLKRNEA